MFRSLIVLVMLSTFALAQEQAAAPPATAPTPPPPTPATGSPRPSVVVKKMVKAVYPLQAAEKGIQGQVVLRVLVSTEGDVESSEVVSGEKELTQAALDAIKKWKFEPLVIDGKPAKVHTMIPFDFYFAGNAKDVRDVPPPASTDSPAGGEKAGSSDKPLPASVRVSSAVTRGLLLHQVQPIYPQEAKSNHVQGTVVLHALIGEDGRIKNLTVVSGPKELQQAATGAVEQWTYRPYLLMGKPVRVNTTIEVHFNLSWR